VRRSSKRHQPHDVPRRRACTGSRCVVAQRHWPSRSPQQLQANEPTTRPTRSRSSSRSSEDQERQSKKRGDARAVWRTSGRGVNYGRSSVDTGRVPQEPRTPYSEFRSSAPQQQQHSCSARCLASLLYLPPVPHAPTHAPTYPFSRRWLYRWWRWLVISTTLISGAALREKVSISSLAAGLSLVLFLPVDLWRHSYLFVVVSFVS